MRKILITLCLAGLMSGCSSVINPYDSEYTCPKVEKGHCLDAYQAYDISVEKQKGVNAVTKNHDSDKDKNKDGLTDEKAKKIPANLYQDDLYQKLGGLLRDPETPMLIPPKVVRGLFLPSDGDGGELYMGEYVYIIREQPKFILSPSVSD